jgi:hypothetical protein
VEVADGVRDPANVRSAITEDTLLPGKLVSRGSEGAGDSEQVTFTPTFFFFSVFNPCFLGGWFWSSLPRTPSLLIWWRQVLYVLVLTNDLGSNLE